MSDAGPLLTMRGGVPTMTPAADLFAPPPEDLAALARRVAALEARPVAVPLAAALPVATVQVGTAVFKVACKGLLLTDRVSVQPAPGAVVPAGLMLGWARPDAADVLAVCVAAVVVATIKSALALDVTAQR